MGGTSFKLHVDNRRFSRIWGTHAQIHYDLWVVGAFLMILQVKKARVPRFPVSRPMKEVGLSKVLKKKTLGSRYPVNLTTKEAHLPKASGYSAAAY